MPAQSSLLLLRFCQVKNLLKKKQPKHIAFNVISWKRAIAGDK